MNADVWLFSYGTLQQGDVQFATFGRRLEGRADALPGYVTSLFETKDTDVRDQRQDPSPHGSSDRRSGR